MSSNQESWNPTSSYQVYDRPVGGTLTLLFIAVPHGNALHTVRGRHGRRGFLDSEPVVNGLIALVVQRAVQHFLQPEVTVRLLHDKNKEPKQA